jgi:hypothetical protein
MWLFLTNFNIFSTILSLARVLNLYFIMKLTCYKMSKVESKIANSSWSWLIYWVKVSIWGLNQAYQIGMFSFHDFFDQILTSFTFEINLIFNPFKHDFSE